ncbi:MAG: hypothetical protein NW206_20100 [Hyphomonadaceae bacterium]|nr:hypothetical protein [Hyphomonadaceae bacterium]
MGSGTRRLYAVGGLVAGLALTAPVIWYLLYRQTHGDADLNIVAAVFFGLVGLIGVNMALRSIWIMIRGH